MDKLFITIVLLTALIAGYIVYDTSKEVGTEMDKQAQTASAVWNKASSAGIPIKSQEVQKPTEDGNDVAPASKTPKGNYILSSVNGQSVEGGDKYTLLVTESKLSGRICNSFSGSYTTDGSNIEAGPLAATKMACIGEAGTFEEIFFKVIGSNPVFINQEGQMTMASGVNTIVFTHVYE
jgi:heat shock protein HslJ